MAIRKNYRNLTSDERELFTKALDHVKDIGVVDRFASLHAMHFSHGIHVSSHFLPWHREFLLRFERELQARFPDVMLPYWDSSADQRASGPLWAQDFLGQFDRKWDLERVLGEYSLPTPAQVAANQRKGSYGELWPELERKIHNPPHVWVGGVMASSASPGDPVFYLHHGWIDLLWAKWQLAKPAAPFEASGSGLGRTDPLMGWPDRTPADVLDHHRLGYSYDVESSGVTEPAG